MTGARGPAGRFLRPAFLWAVAGCLIVAAAAAGDGPDQVQSAIDQNSAKLAELRAKIERSRKQIAALDDREAEVRRGYEEILQEIELSGTLLSQMAERERTLVEQSQLLESDLSVSRRAYESRKEILARNLRSMYLRQDRSPLEGMLTAGSFSNLVARARMSRMLARLEASMVESTLEQARLIIEENKQLDSALAEIHRSREDMALENGRMEMLMAEQQAALRELDDERKDLRNSLLELNLNEQKLNYILADLEEQRTTVPAVPVPEGTELVGLTGNLEWPARGQVIRSFGRSVHPRYQTVTMNNGINIAGQVGAPVAAVAAGNVEFCDQLPGFGRCVILDHGAGYYTLYAYLDRAFVAPGAAVARGQVIAEVGRPAQGEEPQLYFEVRQGRTPLDPGDWLRPR
ncbi:MAG: murein hydrolase activator EnvC [Candidatus Krumholzibacteriia bacterium]